MFRFLVLALVIGGAGIAANYVIVHDWALAALIAAIAVVGAAIGDDNAR